MNWRTHPTERGAVTLLLVMGLVLLATLASAYSSRAVLTELLVSQGLDRGAQADWPRRPPWPPPRPCCFSRKP